MEVSSRKVNVVSSAYCESLTGVLEPGGMMPCIRGLERILRARISAVRTYSGIDRAQPCRRPLSRFIKDVSQPFTLTELETEL